MSTELIDGDPQRLGGYWLAGRLGAGGQGVVYEAYDAGGRRVAVKVLHGDAGVDPELRSRFGREAAAARKVASFCTAAVIDVDLDGARPYIVSEYVEGPSLRSAVGGGRRFGGGDLHRLATAVATALTAIHDAGVVHRDLKPDNVLLGPDGPRVIDFGVARTADMSLTATGVVAGTPTYMAPEVFMGERAGSAADVFAWGGVVLFAATGADPFQGETLGAVMHRVLSVEPSLEALPGHLRPLVAAALSKDPGSRPSARQVLLALTSKDGTLDTARLLTAGSGVGALVRTDAADPALGVLAEECYAALGPVERELAPELFLRLVTVTGDGQQIPRRARWAELLDGRPDDERAAVRRVLEAFDHLLAQDEQRVWLSRPALPIAWPRLRQWIEANRDDLVAHQEILSASWRWHAEGRPNGHLFQGATLDSAANWAVSGRRAITLSSVEREFLEASAALHRRRVRRRRLVAVTVAVLLVAALVAGTLAVRQSGLAAEQAALARERNATIAFQRDQDQARRLAAAAESLRTTDPQRAMLLSVAAWRHAPLVEARAALMGSLARRETAAFRDPDASARTVRALSRDGRLLASAGEGRVRLWDVRTGKQLGGFAGVGDGLRSAALSPSGALLALAGPARVRVWDVATGKPVGRARDFTGAADTDFVVRFGQAEDRLLVTVGQGQRLWDLTTGAMKDLPPDLFGGLDITPDGRTLVSGGFEARPALVDLAAMRATRFGLDCECGPSAAFGPGGRTVALSGDKTVEVYDASTGRVLRRLAHGNGGEPVFSPRGDLLAAATSENIRIWRVRDGRLLLSHRIDATDPALAFDPDGGVLRYLTEERVTTVDITDVTRPVTVGRTTAYDAELSPDGRLIAFVREGEGTGAVTLWDVRRRELLTTLRMGRGTTGAQIFLDFSGDGRRLAAVWAPPYPDGASLPSDSATDPKAVVWDTSTFERVTTVVIDADAVSATAVNADGTALTALVGEEPYGRQELRLWQVPGGRLRWSRVQENADPMSTDLMFTPDGAAIAITGDEQRLLDASTGKPFDASYVPAHAGRSIDPPAAGEGGWRFATVDTKGRLSVRRIGGGQPVGPETRTTWDLRAVFSPRGETIATMAGSRSVALWDTATGRRLGAPVTTGIGNLLDLAFTADGSRLVTVDDAGTLSEHPVAPEPVVSAVCGRAGRTLSPEEWRLFVGTAPYRDVCART
ncbi:serine/threonine-protein kinase [Planomonospora sp. ID82291]|uniref:serine/threonine-protein kinase n=1 Tax=Planomonospora sp. ID82291 TaxID=2738136 RepID=UPI0018C41BBD|nr:serine/threonine-protein kinase [Planomonospora sp. ID82291]MBG0815682.1 protein kinase [Planomonospora sp. ID82291]